MARPSNETCWFDLNLIDNAFHLLESVTQSVPPCSGFLFLPVTVGLLLLVGLLPFSCGLAPGPLSATPPPLSIGTTDSSGVPLPIPVG